MDMKKKISIIIPTIRKGGLLEFQLKGFIGQILSKEDFEIIIVDDYIDKNNNNDDNIEKEEYSRKEIVEKYGRDNNLNIKWMRSKKPYWRSNANIANARNTGLIYAEGELIVFIDDYSWIKPDYLNRVWNIYKNNPIREMGYSHIGPLISIDKTGSETRTEREIIRYVSCYGIDNYPKQLVYKEHRSGTGPCIPGWFYTSNASVPLDLIIKLNGFWEIADLTREEDILMGLALDRIGWKFYFIDDPDIGVYHMVHDFPYSEGVLGCIENYHNITYQSIGCINGLNTSSDCIQLVTTDIFNTSCIGSLALIEYFNRNLNLIFNKEDIRTEIFDLAEERRKVKGEKEQNMTEILNGNNR